MQFNHEKPSTAMGRLWRWSGIGEKTLLELLQITAAIVASVAIPIVLNMISYQQERTKDDNQRHEILSNYLDQMTQLLLEKDKELDNPSLRAEAQKFARARTLNTLRQLDGERKGQLLKFLYEAGLIGEYCQINRKTLELIRCETSDLQIDLEGARLNGTVFEPPVPLQRIDLTGALLSKAGLQGIYLAKAEMRDATLTGADLTKAVLTEAQMEGADLTEVKLVGAILPRANLIKVRLESADLRGANLEAAQLMGAEIQKAKLSKTNLTKANFKGANLEKADLSNADLQGADLSDADLTGTNLQGANLKGALYDKTTKFSEEFDPVSEGMRQQ